MILHTAVRDACALIKPDKVKPITYYKYRRLYRKCYGDRAHIASSLRRSTNEQIKLQKAQLHFLDTMIPLYYREDRASKPSKVYQLAESAIELHTKGYWIDPCKCKGEVPKNLLDELIKVLGQKLPMQAILDNPEKKALLSPIEILSLGFFYEYFRWFEALPEQGRRVLNSRYGKGTWEQLYMIFDTFAHQASFPLQYVFADHYLLDVFIVDEATRSKLDRLWVTVLIDAYSRCILGMALLYEEPCIDSIQRALLHAIWPKTSHREIGIDGEWVCFGIPQQLYLDNAWAHHSHSLENLARTIGHGGKYHTIDLVFRPPYKARYGALIESFFGNFSGRIKQELPGAIQSSDPKHVRDAARKACLLYEDVYRYLQQFIVRYQHTPHSALGEMTPHEKWMEGMQMGLPNIPPLTPTVKRLFLRLGHGTRQITTKGICVFGMNYTSSALHAAEVIGKDGKPVQYSYRYDPADISTIALYLQERFIGDISAKELRLPDGTLKPTSWWELNLAKALARGRPKDTEDWLAYLNEAERLGKKRKSERDAARRRQKNDTNQERENEFLESPEEELEGVSLEGDEYHTQLLADFES